MSNSEENKDKVRMKFLKLAAEETSQRFRSPIYLVGSYLEKGFAARDMDIIMVVTENRFKRLFESIDDPNYEKVFYFRKKEKEWFEMYVTDMDIDFKVVTMNEFIKDKGKKLKLDEVVEYPE